ncbi:glycosyl hydrolase superfamily protein [Actinidia rufa]|uniref:Glycosyl hydrolase superfamily protein n=1 Tax=Actinidia rufa TaxID=165716 RepID=A0A7J0DKR0_9ERIC|nr:glycosyl hydrolase superfamily protein [Actinidia rufa]
MRERSQTLSSTAACLNSDRLIGRATMSRVDRPVQYVFSIQTKKERYDSVSWVRASTMELPLGKRLEDAEERNQIQIAELRDVSNGIRSLKSSKKKANVVDVDNQVEDDALSRRVGYVEGGIRTVDLAEGPPQNIPSLSGRDPWCGV